ncbi:ribulose-phosphate 3-epimerase [Rickettsiales endosymbiont of Trichoplax sp. H2]|uniref:ribulose-phosphate 3-epimerase n=1 Tax=Rickettsiales endosymbiont of Trichoplax sp. H2 TaxID=2021221 RepID=UPI0012B42D07|nr:ribulose-phosphate 3-epimerase [Rickettsiales endosymbiont of Trichoplax sp. H2]MSO13429.1 Ribulose-phosphate 3-epimerase [Rickettsiales endosymbiont of Trichoplax sp. H2]
MTTKKHKISASILAADFSILKEEVKNISTSGADSIHLDIMDGHFVPNLTFGPDIVKCIKKESSIPLKTHLMIKNPEKYIDAYIEAGSDAIIFHQETVTHIDRFIDYIKSKNVKAGISIVPSTHESTLKYICDKLDEILIMTVNPGFGGQKFLNSQLEKIKNISIMTSNIANIDIGVDGGINPTTLTECVKNGTNLAIAGSYIFKSTNYKERVIKLKNCFN